MSFRPRLTLFWCIFLSIWLAMAVTAVASYIITQTLQERELTAIERQASLREIALQALDYRRDSDGARLWRFLKSEGQRLDLHLRLIEVARDDKELPQVIRERLASSDWYHLKPAVIPVSEDYQLVAWPRKGAEGWVDSRLYRWLELLVAFVIITLACWWVAKLVSRPLKHMESAARDIAAGDTGLRVSNRIASRQDEIGALAIAFNGMTERFCYLLDRQKHLTRDISHDLRTPLARQHIAIKLASESEADASLMASILRQNERLQTMTSQILTLYQVTEAGDDIAREPIKPVAVMNRVLLDAADYAEHQGVDCRFQAPRDVAETLVLGDEELLQRAVENVLQNALDRTPPGKVVKLSVSGDATWVRLTIEDEGPGVAEECLGELFEPFNRADQSRGGTGWGLGLAIARDIVSAQDGQVEAKIAESGGLVVEIRLLVLIGDRI